MYNKFMIYYTNYIWNITTPNDQVLETLLTCLKWSRGRPGKHCRMMIGVSIHGMRGKDFFFTVNLPLNVQYFLSSSIRRQCLVKCIQSLCLCVSFRNLSPGFSTQVLTSLCECIEKSEDKNVCAKSLWCLHQQSIGKNIVSQQVRVLAV